MTSAACLSALSWCPPSEFMFVVASDDVSSMLVSSELVPSVKVLLTDGQTLAEILCNVLTLVISISKSRESPEHDI